MTKGSHLYNSHLDQVKEKLAAVIKEAASNDPKALKAEIATLRQQMTAAAAAAAKAGSYPAMDPKAIEAAEQRGFEQAKKKLGAAADKEFKVRLGAIITALRGAGDAFAGDVKKIVGDLVGPTDLRSAVAYAPAPAAPVPRPVPSLPPRSPSRAKPATPIGDDDRPLRAERKPLAVLAGVHPGGMTEAQWAVASGLKRSGGTWSTYVSRLRLAGRIEDRGGEFVVTEQGLLDLGGDVAQLPPPGPELVEFWAARITGAAPMLRYLAQAYPNFVDREQMATDLSLASGGGTFSTYISRLRSPGLIEDGPEKSLRASPMLMEGRAAA